MTRIGQILSPAIVRAPIGVLVLLLSMQSAAYAQATLGASVTADKRSVYLHESFSLTITVVANNVRLGKHFELQGLPPDSLLERLTGFSELPPKREQVGESYRDIRRSTVQVRAMKPGRLTVAPQMLIGILTRRQGLLGSRMVESVRDLAVQPLHIAVKPLPTSRTTEDFSGAIGKFSMNVHVAPATVSIGDLVTITTTITGDGYLDAVSPPALSVGKHFKVYDPRILSRKKDTSITFEQIVIPQTADSSEITTVALSYFDPDEASYKVLSQGPFNLTFKPPEEIKIEQFQPDDRNSDEFKLTTSPSDKPENGKDAEIALSSGVLWRLAKRGALVRFAAQENARIAPSRAAKVTFEIGAGTDATVVETYRDWTRIRTENAGGWVPTESIRTEQE